MISLPAFTPGCGATTQTSTILRASCKCTLLLCMCTVQFFKFARRSIIITILHRPSTYATAHKKKYLRASSWKSQTFIEPILCMDKKGCNPATKLIFYCAGFLMIEFLKELSCKVKVSLSSGAHEILLHGMTTIS